MPSLESMTAADWGVYAVAVAVVAEKVIVWGNAGVDWFQKWRQTRRDDRKAAVDERLAAEKQAADLKATAETQALAVFQGVIATLQQEMAEKAQRHADDIGELSGRLERCEKRHDDRDRADADRDKEMVELQNTVKVLKKVVELKGMS